MSSLKILFAFLIMVLFFLSCTSSKNVINKPATSSVNIDDSDGLGLISRSDCFTCHKANEKFIGPSFSDIANKYQNASDSMIEKLSNKIINGGPGSWGTVPMAPHPQKSHEEATIIVKFILTKYK